MKTEGWESRLAKYFDEMRDKPFKRGSHDCALFAGNCVDIMTETDTTSEFRQPYKTLKEALKMLKEMGYEDLSAIANKKLGEPLSNPAYAQRGDCVLIQIDDQQALGIVDLSGRKAITIGKEGFIYFGMENWVKVWALN